MFFAYPQQGCDCPEARRRLWDHLSCQWRHGRLSADFCPDAYTDFDADPAADCHANGDSHSTPTPIPTPAPAE